MGKGIFDLIAPVYDLFDKMFLSRKEIMDRIDIDEHDKVLDMGGGTGSLLKKIMERKENGETYLLDVSREMMGVSTFSEHKVIGKACRSPFDSDSFDLVLCVDALHHFPNKKDSLEEMVRVLKPDGEILILEFDPKSSVTKFIEFGERSIGEPSFFLEIDDLKEFFQNKGFDTTIDKLNSYQYILKSVKD